MTATIIEFPTSDKRLAGWLAEMVSVAGLDGAAGEIGSPDDWAWSAIIYLKEKLSAIPGETLGGTVEVSAAAVGLALHFIETLATKTGDIAGPGAAA